MQSWQAQKFASDVIYDLRTRGLLPIAVLLLIGMVALPMVILRAGGDQPIAAPTSQPDEGALAPENQAAVIAYQPGLRDYRQRLSQLPEKNPFRQQFTAPAAGAVAAAGSTPDGSGASVVGGDGTGGSGTTSPGGGTGTPGGTTTTRQRFYFYETDVAVGEAGAKQKKINRVSQFAYLPSQKIPVVAYLGAASEGPVAIFLVSEGVVGIEGAPDCAPSTEECQMIALGEGETARLTYGPNGKTYSLKVTRVERVVRKKLPEDA